MRNNDWAEKMWEVFYNHSETSFEWGINDCCLFVARTVDAMSGSSIEQDLSAIYQNEIGAMKYIAKSGGLIPAISIHLGEPVTGIPMRGDIVVVDGGEGLAAGVCIGNHIACLATKGMQFLPKNEILARWAV
ncbi:hypothetical protein UFOVP605_52 [uncultured Caudovirales phage]|uniref:DUF6950 domain-containing protein n=1 Tax=uncultured Caudovirales phage TaxID=2100421 RepID=A0A6J5N5E2_9CAUD|nr:hypothetical protein UFOVP605_52 [uncultured Caudovirales phage]